MTSGNTTALKTFSWPKNLKKRQRSGSGGSAKEHQEMMMANQNQQQKKKNFLSGKSFRNHIYGGKGSSSPHHPNQGQTKSSSPSNNRINNSSNCALEVEAPVTSDVEFKFTWHIDRFLREATRKLKHGASNSTNSSTSSRNSLSSGCYEDDDPHDLSEHNNNGGGGGLDSKPFDININGVRSTWSLSIRFWTGEDGERLPNPFVLCLNMLSHEGGSGFVGVKYKFGFLNVKSSQFEILSSETKQNVFQGAAGGSIKSIGYRNVAISDKHLAKGGALTLICKIKLLKDDSTNHSLSADLSALINDDKSADLIVEAGGKAFKVHRNILSARSPVFADLLTKRSNSVEAESTAPSSSNSEGDDVEQVGEKLKESSVTVKDEQNNKQGQNQEGQKEPSSTKSRPRSSTLPSNCRFTIREKKANSETEMDQNGELSDEPSLPKLEIRDLNAETLELLLKYIYTDNSIDVDGKAQSLLDAAQKLGLHGLKSHCEKHFGEILSPGNVASVLMLADTYDCEKLKRSALRYCKSNHTYIMKDHQWKAIEEERPELFEEAVSEVVRESLCDRHDECLKKGGKRFEIERTGSVTA